MLVAGGGGVVPPGGGVVAPPGGGVVVPAPSCSSVAGEILDTGVCHMTFFTDPDGNDLMLHHRYAPYE